MFNHKLVTKTFGWLNLILIVCWSRDIKFDDVRKYVYIHGHLIKTLELDVLLKCLQHCVLERDCESVNFDKDNSVCNLLNVAFTYGKGCNVYSTNEKNWTYYGPKQATISNMFNTPTCFDACPLNPCQEYEVCTFDGSSHTCACPLDYSGDNCKIGNKVVCEADNAVFTITCPTGKNIQVINANYGRTNAGMCTPSTRTNCEYAGSLTKVKDNCDGQPSCTFQATNTFFGTDPCSGVPKYTEVWWQCDDS